MAFKFKRRQKVFPGFHLNFSSKGISTTVGVKGLSVNFSKSGTYLNAGIPGTGIRSRKKISGGKKRKVKEPAVQVESTNQDPIETLLFLPEKLEGEIKSKGANEVTSRGLLALKETLLAAYHEKLAIENEVIKVGKQTKTANIIRFFSKLLIIGFFVKWFDNNYLEKKEYFENLKVQLDECKVEIDIEMEKAKDQNYQRLRSIFDELMDSDKIWDMTSSISNDDNRSSASHSVRRTETQIGFKKIPFLNADYDAMFFENKNGSDIYIYPGFAALFDDRRNFGLVELKELKIDFDNSKFLEEEAIPPDSIIVGETWAKVNKNGSPDKRFKDNYKIPIVQYGELKFKSNSGIDEVFMFSNAGISEEFKRRYSSYVY